MRSFPVFLLLFTLSRCNEDEMRGAHRGQSFLGTQDRLRHQTQKREKGVSSRVVLLDTAFTLRFQVKDAVNHQSLSQASVNVYVNYTFLSATKTSSDGFSVLSIPYKQGSSLTLVVNKDGYIQTAQPWKTIKTPVYSSVALSLFPQNQGNIWLFEDSVIITGKTSEGVMPKPNVQFPRSLLSLPGCNISFLMAYLTGLQFPAEKHYPYTTGIITSKSGYISVDLKPVAAVSVQLLCKGEVVQVKGPVKITLPLPENSLSKPSDTIPAWSFNRKTGAWMNHGLGIVKVERSRLVWEYDDASHLGYWIAAPFPSPTGYMGHESTLDFTSYHTYFLMATLGGTLVIALGLSGVMSCYCRNSLCKPEKKRVGHATKAVQMKDQTTCTNGHLDFSIKDREPHEESSHLAASQSMCRRNQPVNCEIKWSFRITDEKSGYPALPVFENVGGTITDSSKTSQKLPVHINSSEIVAPRSQKEQRLVLYNQPVRDHFSSSGQTSGSSSAALPRKAVRYENMEKSVRKSTFAQTFPRTPRPSHIHKQLKEEAQALEIPYGEPGLCNSPGNRNYFNGLPESVSVPETLSESVGMNTFCGNQGVSENTLREPSRSKPFPHAKAWFVSLEGRPAARVRHSILDLQRSPFLTDSNDTSLDSGVDLNEQQMDVRRITQTQPLCTDVDMSGSNSATTTACSPEEPA